MATTHKAIAHSRELADLLRKWLPTYTLVETNDSDGNPVITVSEDATPAFGEEVVVIRTKGIAWGLAKDIVGNDAIQYAGHVIQICTEKNYEGADDTILDILGPNVLLPILIECGRKGTWVEWYRTDNGTIPSTAAMISDNLAATWKDLYFNILKAS